MPKGFALLLASAAAFVPGPGAGTAAEPTNGVSLQVDMDGDGLADRFAMERSGEKIAVTVALADGVEGKLEFATEDFYCSVIVPDPACGDFGQPLESFPLTREAISDLALTFDLDDTGIFVGNGRAGAISASPGETDPFVFFWNAKSGQLDWLRL